jgi:thiol-disulfide isomerase/thioredoxin
MNGKRTAPSRRSVLAGIAGLAAIPSACADTSPVAHGILANNPIAQAFESTPSDLPDVTLIGLNGPRNLSDFKGRTLLVPLWAEWCTPCLSEIPDFARLQKKYGNDRFAIVPVLTGTRKKMSPTTVAQLFQYLHADTFEPLIEVALGAKLMNGMAQRYHGRIEIPCNLLIAPDGHVVGREFGVKRDTDQDAEIAADTKEAPHANTVLACVEAGDTLSLWGKEAGEQFAAAMANGFLA